MLGLYVADRLLWETLNVYFEKLFRINNLCINLLHIDRQMSNDIETSGNFQGWHLFRFLIKQQGKQADFEIQNLCTGRKGDWCHLSSLVRWLLCQYRKVLKVKNKTKNGWGLNEVPARRRGFGAFYWLILQYLHLSWTKHRDLCKLVKNGLQRA